MRIAYAVASLLGSLESGKANDRITALRSLRDEVFLSLSGFYQKNTARVPIGVREEYIPKKLGFSLDEDYSKSVYQLF